MSIRTPVPSARQSRDEAALIRRAQAGDMAAFERLMSPHAAYLYSLALRLLGDAREAEDLAQEALLRAWNGLPGFRIESSLRTWLYRIVTNLGYNRLPRLRADLAAIDTDAAALTLPDDRQRPEANLLARDLGEQLQAAIDALPDPYRLLICLRHLDELSYAEIAEVTGMPLGTVKTGIHRGRRRLQAALAERQPAGLRAADPHRAESGPAGQPATRGAPAELRPEARHA